MVTWCRSRVLSRAKVVADEAAARNRKTFVVSALIGHFAGMPWPLGRFYVSDEAIAVRT
jgi:hypothetical protein